MSKSRTIWTPPFQYFNGQLLVQPLTGPAKWGCTYQRPKIVFSLKHSCIYFWKAGNSFFNIRNVDVAVNCRIWETGFFKTV